MRSPLTLHPQNLKSALCGRCIFHLTQDWRGLGSGHYSGQTKINAEEEGDYSSHLLGHF